MTMDEFVMDELEQEQAEKQELLIGDGSAPKKPQIMAKQGENDVEKRPPTPDEEENDPIADIIGNYGPWQLKLTFLLSLCSFPCTFHIFSPTFIAANQDFTCARPKHLSNVPLNVWLNYSQTKNSCFIKDLSWDSITPEQMIAGNIPHAGMIPCTSWEWDTSILTTTIISEWELICDRAYLSTLAEVLFLFGVGVGGVVSGMISDRFGRKKTLIFALVMQTVLAIAVTFCPWYELYLVLRVILGFFCVSVVFSGFVLSVELVGGKWRTIAGVCNFFPLPVSYILVSALSMALPNWRQLQLALSLPGILLITLWWVVPESPRWLLTMGRIAEVKEILQQAAKVNKRELPASLDKILQPDNKPSDDEHRSFGVLDLFKKPIGKITACIFIGWGATTLVYYGLVLNISSFGGDLHITSMLSGVVEIPAIALSIPILLKAGRRYPICFTIVFAGIGCIGVALVDAYSDKLWLKITFAMVSKFSISATNGVLPMYTAELYPTLMRNLGVGVSQVIAGISLVCIPYVWTLKEPLPLVVMGILGVLGGLCVLLLPETANKSLNSVQYEERSQMTQNQNASNHNGPFTISEAK